MGIQVLSCGQQVIVEKAGHSGIPDIDKKKYATNENLICRLGGVPLVWRKVVMIADAICVYRTAVFPDLYSRLKLHLN